MRTSLSSARDKKTDFHPRTGGNRYRVTKEQAVPDTKADASEIDIEKEVQATTDNSGSGVGAVQGGGEGKKSSEKARSGFNTDFLLARALQTTVQNTRNTT